MSEYGKLLDAQDVFRPSHDSFVINIQVARHSPRIPPYLTWRALDRQEFADGPVILKAVVLRKCLSDSSDAISNFSVIIQFSPSQTD
jgi:hypothetical protein